nr:hypothetical protein CFP56_33641 [Quercus suber]
MTIRDAQMIVSIVLGKRRGSPYPRFVEAKLNSYDSQAVAWSAPRPTPEQGSQLVAVLSSSRAATVHWRGAGTRSLISPSLLTPCRLSRPASSPSTDGDAVFDVATAAGMSIVGSQSPTGSSHENGDIRGDLNNDDNSSNTTLSVLVCSYTSNDDVTDVATKMTAGHPWTGSSAQSFTTCLDLRAARGHRKGHGPFHWSLEFLSPIWEANVPEQIEHNALRMSPQASPRSDRPQVSVRGVSHDDGYMQCGPCDSLIAREGSTSKSFPSTLPGQRQSIKSQAIRQCL